MFFLEVLYEKPLKTFLELFWNCSKMLSIKQGHYRTLYGTGFGEVFCNCSEIFGMVVLE